MKADRDNGVRSDFIKTSVFNLNLSFSASLPLYSAENKARESMPNVDSLFEVGPQVIFHLFRSPDYGVLNLRLPLRAVYSASLKKTVDRGFHFAPALTWKKLHTLYQGHEMYLTLSSSFATKRFQRLFFEVDPIYATNERPAYSVKEGYLSSQLRWVHIFPYKDLKFFSFYSLSSLQGSTNQQSPLFKDPWNHTFGLAVSWTFFKSEEKAEL